MKKRILALVLLLCMLLTLNACKKDEEPVVTEESTEPTTLSAVVPESARADASYFDDVVFIGDSISEGLSNCEAAEDKMGGAQFLTSVSLSATNALWEVSSRSVHPRYRGEKMKVERAVALSGATKVYLMLGMNDIIAVGVDKAAANFEKLCDAILTNAPDVELFVESVTPLAGEGKTSGEHTLNNATISQYNALLETMCLNRGWHYLNVAEALRGADGYLRTDLCSDPNGMGMLLTFGGCEAWIDYLYTHTLTDGGIDA